MCHECKDEYVKIAFPHVIYGYDPEKNVIANTFWAFKRDLMMLEELDSSIKDYIPAPEYAQTPTIVLTYPWQNFSVGTRFKHIPAADTQESFGIATIDYQQQKAFIQSVPREDALEEIKQSPEAARKLFVRILTTLVNRVAQNGNKNVIPYVWGGSSYTKAYADGQFY